jgi:hypothetical protein
LVEQQHDVNKVAKDLVEFYKRLSAPPVLSA